MASVAVSVVSADDGGLARVSRDAPPDELAESEESRLLACPLLLVPLAVEGTTRLPSPSRTIGMSLSLGEDALTAADLPPPVTMEEAGELLPGVDG